MMHILYCLWLVPRSDQAHVISQMISKLSSQYDTPIFPPHVTLASASSEGENEETAKEWHQSVSEKLRENICNSPDANFLKLRFGRPRAGATRHQCVLVDVESGYEYDALLRRVCTNDSNLYGVS